MTRSIALVVAFCSIGWAQGQTPEVAFFQAVDTLEPRELGGTQVAPSVLIQDELRLSAEDTEVLLATVRSYESAVAGVERALRRTIFERRMRVIGEEDVALPAESELIAERDRQVAVLAARSMQELRVRLGEATFQQLRGYIGGEEFFPLRDGEKRLVAVRR